MLLMTKPRALYMFSVTKLHHSPTGNDLKSVLPWTMSIETMACSGLL